MTITLDTIYRKIGIKKQELNADTIVLLGFCEDGKGQSMYQFLYDRDLRHERVKWLEN